MKQGKEFKCRPGALMSFYEVRSMEILYNNWYCYKLFNNDQYES